jgi:polar amino acid transport system permease protein
MGGTRGLDAFFEWFRWLYDTTGINLTIFYDPFDRKRFIGGFFTTVTLAGSCILLSVVIGILGAWLQGSRLRLTRHVVYWYIQFFRNTPPLVQLYFFYFGVGSLLTTANAAGTPVPMVSNVAWAIVSLSFFAGAFNVEIFRSGIEAVPRTTVEAAESLGFSRLRTYVLIVLPLAFRISLPALNNNLVNLVKTTTLAYAIAVPEMLYVSSQIWSDELNVPEMMNVLLLCYFALVGFLVYVMHRWERAIRVPGFGV